MSSSTRFCSCGPSQRSRIRIEMGTRHIGMTPQNRRRAIELISPSKASLRLACALRLSGTTARISFALRICRADIEMACFGT